jgi:hypothetical protein
MVSLCTCFVLTFKPKEVGMSLPLPFIATEDGVAAGQAQEMPSEGAAMRRAEAMSRDNSNVGALAFKRTGDPSLGSFADATVLRSFGKVPENLDEL